MGGAGGRIISKRLLANFETVKEMQRSDKYPIIRSKDQGIEFTTVSSCTNSWTIDTTKGKKIYSKATNKFDLGYRCMTEDDEVKKNLS